MSYPKTNAKMIGVTNKHPHFVVEMEPSMMRNAPAYPSLSGSERRP